MTADADVLEWLTGFCARSATPDQIELLTSLVDEATIAAVASHLADDTELRAEARALWRAQWQGFLSALALRIFEVRPPAELAALARATVVRGLGLDVVTSVVQVGKRTVWNYLVAVLEAEIADPELRGRALVLIWNRATEWMDESLEVWLRHHADELDRDRSGDRASRTVFAILRGEDVDGVAAETELRHPLALPQTALVLSAEAEPEPGQDLSELLSKLAAAVGSPALLVDRGPREAWAWVVTDGPVRLPGTCLPDVPGLRLAVGNTAAGVAGMRRSHRQARAARRVQPGATVVHYADVEAVCLATGDGSVSAMRELARRELGALTHPDEATTRIRETLTAHVTSGAETATTAGLLGVHPNSVRYRLRQAEALIGHSLTERTLELELALRFLSEYSAEGAVPYPVADPGLADSAVRRLPPLPASREVRAVLASFAARHRDSEETRRVVAAVDERIRACLPQLPDDAGLLSALAASTRANWIGFATAVEREPFQVRPPEAALDWGRTLARRNLDSDTLVKVYRVGQRAVWGHVVDLLTREIPSSSLRSAVLVHLWDLAMEWLDTTHDAVVAAYHAERGRWREGALARRTALVRAVLRGETVDFSEASGRLAHPLHLHHTAFVAWLDAPVDQPDAVLDALAGRVATAFGAGRALTIPNGAEGLWGWLATARPVTAWPDLDLSGPRVRFAFGSCATGPDGFRRSHREALAAERIALTGTRRRRITRYRDVELVCLTTGDGDRAGLDILIDRELGALAAATEAATRLRETARLFLRHGGDVKAVADRLGLHANTVRYRIARAEELLGHPITERRAHVELALRGLEILGGNH
ncbi:PucR family transcriptional regulator [Nocardia huaxiensis]|uniref:PucR family transcriptional regulator n=1 Tax=Nocardia huaxiensis TaxID=2755382 RepID=UPI001E33BB3A|nr:helix-turn-helix domain-containing protein [Nocardia huaxiensis]UFS97636.1 helix-turn-helix domain-containing protein [Nocardia huaxiensis]